MTISYSNRTVLSAPAHRARDTIALLRRDTPDLIFPDQWSQNSPDMNPVDYTIWAVLQQRVYEKRVNDDDELCQSLLCVWHSIGQNVIDEAIISGLYLGSQAGA